MTTTNQTNHVPLADAIAITTKDANDAIDPVRHFVFSPSSMTWHGRGR